MCMFLWRRMSSYYAHQTHRSTSPRSHEASLTVRILSQRTVGLSHGKPVHRLSVWLDYDQASEVTYNIRLWLRAEHDPWTRIGSSIVFGIRCKPYQFPARSADIIWAALPLNEVHAWSLHRGTAPYADWIPDIRPFRWDAWWDGRQNGSRIWTCSRRSAEEALRLKEGSSQQPLVYPSLQKLELLYIPMGNVPRSWTWTSELFAKETWGGRQARWPSRRNGSLAGGVADMANRTKLAELCHTRRMRCFF